jgi:energy-coupling factor transport system permease protein
LVAFSLPLFFNSGTHILFNTPYLKITHEGLSTGAILAFRILFLIFISSLLVRTTSPEELTAGLARMLSFLRYLGISGKKVAMTLSLSWMGIPFFWETARRTIRSANIKKTKKLLQLIPALSNLIATLYVQAAPESTYWQCAFPKQEKVDSCQLNCKGQATE